MLECLILGDSIGVGTAIVRKDCVSYSVGGYNSWQWNRRFHDKDLTANTVIISLGSNDHAGVKTETDLRFMRANAKAQRVFWILPAIKPNIQELVKKVANDFGDVVIPIVSLQPDKVHPSWKGYQAIAEATK